MSSASKMVPEEVAGSSRGVRKCSSGGGVRASTSRKNGNMSLAINAVAPVLNKMYVIRTLDIIENRDAVRVVARLRDEEKGNFLMIYLPANIAMQYLADQEGFEEHYKALEIIEFSADNVVEAVNMLTLEDIGAKIKQEMEEAIDPIPEDISTVDVPEEYRHSFGNTIAKSSSGKLATMVYATIGLPVMFMYLSSMGSLLSICARHVFSRTLCCCLCSKCGYCCYDEKLMEEKERRMRRKRQQREYQQQIAAAVAAHHSQPFYVKSPSLTSLEQAAPVEEKRPAATAEGATVDAKLRSEYSRFLAPLVICLLFTFVYVLLGSFMLLKFDVNWSPIDSIYFSFMLITTVGIDDTMPLGSALSPNAQYGTANDSLLVWFFSFYIFVGLGFSSMCYCTIRDGLKRKMNRLYAFSDSLRCSRRQPSEEFELTRELSLQGTTEVS